MKRLFFYLIAVLVFGVGVAVTLREGQKLSPPKTISAPASVSVQAQASTLGGEPSDSLWANLRANLQEPLTRLLIQVIVIILAARLCGAIAALVRQPVVIGEMIAGILLGPSLLGWIWPETFQFIFPASSLGVLRLFSQIGVCLFMFVVGMELDIAHLKQHARTAVLVSQVSFFFPYLLGVIASLFLYSTLAGANTSFVAFALFIGISMSITAFPVLARILEERRLMRTALGSAAIACAATGDVTAWAALALVVSISKAGNPAGALVNLGLVVVFVVVMIYVIRPLLPRWLDRAAHSGNPQAKGIVGSAVIFLFVSALATDVMGIHALFGAFLAGVVMPARGEFRDFLKLRLEHFAMVFLLPLFFAFNGLRTQINLLNDASGWGICAALVVLATVGKLGGAMATARCTGMNWHDSFGLGALMNTRGLVELIALSIGFDLGILSPRIFAMLVIMALATTLMTSPLLAWNDWVRKWLNRAATSPRPAQP